MAEAGRISKQLWRDLLAMLAWFKKNQLGAGGAAAPTPRNYNKVKAKNSTGADLRRGEVVELDSFQLTEIEPEYLWFIAGIPDFSHSGWGITLKPIPEDDQDDVLLDGVCIAWVSVLNEDHHYARPVTGEVVLESCCDGPVKILQKPTGGTPPDERECCVQLGARLELYIGKTDGAISKGASGTISRYEGGVETDTGINDASVKNLFADLEANKWVAYMRVGCALYLIAGEC